MQQLCYVINTPYEGVFDVVNTCTPYEGIFSVVNTPYEGIFNVVNTPYEGVFNVVNTPYEGVFTVFTNVSTVFTYEGSIYCIYYCCILYLLMYVVNLYTAYEGFTIV